MRHSFIIILLSLFSFSTFASSTDYREGVGNNSRLLHLFICSEEAPMLCKHFNMTKMRAQREIQAHCDSPEAKLKAIWNNNQISEIICTYPNDRECLRSGFDCVLNGRCVLDRSLIPGADSRPDYLRALTDIINNPSNIINYPHLFYICPRLSTR